MTAEQKLGAVLFVVSATLAFILALHMFVDAEFPAWLWRKK